MKHQWVVLLQTNRNSKRQCEATIIVLTGRQQKVLQYATV